MTRTQIATAAPSEISDLVSGVCVRLRAAVFCLLIDLMLTFDVSLGKSRFPDAVFDDPRIRKKGEFF